MQKSAVLLGDFRAPVLDQEKICRGLKLGARWYLARNGCQDVYSVVICLFYLHKHVASPPIVLLFFLCDVLPGNKA